MAAASNETKRSGRFEFEALAAADNYRRALLAEFSPFLNGEVVEVGAGIGQFSEVLLRHSKVRHLISVEPNSEFCREYRGRRPETVLIEGTVSDLPAGTTPDAVVSVNVLEHIEEDERELKIYAGLLKQRAGALCLFVPARQELYAPVDKDFGHFRRYSKKELREKLSAAEFEIVRLHYFNFAGYFAWGLIFRVMRKRAFNPSMVRRFDRLIFPVVHFIESHILRPPFGQNLLAIARAKR